MKLLVLPGDGIGPEITQAGFAAMLLDWLAEKRSLKSCGDAACAISEAVDRVLQRPESRTADLGGPLGTRGFGEAIVAEINR